MAKGKGFEITEEFGVLDVSNNYTKEFNKIRWNSRPPVYDVRTWYLDSNGEKKPTGKGITLSDKCALNLAQALCEEIFGFRVISVGTADDGSMTVEFEECVREPREHTQYLYTDDDIRDEIAADLEKQYAIKEDDK